MISLRLAVNLEVQTDHDSLEDVLFESLRNCPGDYGVRMSDLDVSEPVQIEPGTLAVRVLLEMLVPSDSRPEASRMAHEIAERMAIDRVRVVQHFVRDCTTIMN